ncbi:hypothetical protein [Bradyrhizobium sp. BWA-3-5]|uniref:hypothetical protein n=1 Tax=Bradyrhizobium sp. BWA-3-5 TaxID=3080013 RepID=UPI00293EBDBB|nr:hypothetical protein [Bradyrhizobium sp. BWA-3-5]WOH64016.1 hypothetical protein RX331_25770 [Bradyrhizobium sp. BWA-3-5]
MVPSQLQCLFAAAKQIMDRHTPLIEQEALATMLETGAYNRHVKRVRRATASGGKTCSTLCAADLAIYSNRRRQPPSFHVVVWFRDLPKRPKQR